MATTATSLSTPQCAQPLPISFPEKRRFSRTEYHRLAEIGMIPPDAAVELLNGEIVPMSPIGPQHASVTRKLNDFFALRLSGKFLCSGPNPQATGDLSEPEPDYQVLVRRDDYYADHHPTPDEVVLAIEVADTSLSKDLGPKMQVYAAEGIVEYWVVDLVNRKLHVHTEPDKDAALYKSVKVFSDAEHAAPVAAGDSGSTSRGSSAPLSKAESGRTASAGRGDGRGPLGKR